MAEIDAWDDIVGVVGIFTSALGVLALGCYRSVMFEKVLKKQMDVDPADLTIQTSTAIAFPIISSIALLLLFYFFATMTYVMSMVIIITSVFGIAFTLYPMAELILPQLSNRNVDVPFCGSLSALTFVVTPMSVVCVFMWLVTGHWTLNNVLGLAFCIVALSFVRVPNLKVTTIVMVLLFVYDIFWVFFSSFFFGENVMVAVATKPANNPLVSVAEGVGMGDSVVHELQLPMKLIWGGHILGLGDIVLPGFLLAYAMKFDFLRTKSAWNITGYFTTAFVGYAFGLVLAMVMAMGFNVAQPALLYLVPLSLFPILLLGWKRGEVGELWRGTTEFPEKNADI